MGFLCIKRRARKSIAEENADSAVRSVEAIPEHELCTLRARGKEWAEKKKRKKTDRPTGHYRHHHTAEHNKRDVYPRLFPHS